jgi:hypothetical protein
LSISSSEESRKISLLGPEDRFVVQFPEKLYLIAGEISREEVWGYTVINLPINIDAFNIAGLVVRPDSSKVNVFCTNESNPIYFGFGLAASGSDIVL